LATNKQQRQRILYLHARSPNIRSDVVGAALHEPIAGSSSNKDYSCRLYISSVYFPIDSKKWIPK